MKKLQLFIHQVIWETMFVINMNKLLFSGDHIMDWATSMVSPPYGDLTQFMASCRMLQTKQFDLFLPGHGEPVRKSR